ncbi:heme uptake protein IsdC [Paenibacillus eucommiae]|uniref:Heme uptake protein IsdC n=1 Tax=Paenibacillus eucommiae TaxID=1355755 RepID=A0ABS4J1H9_9BACL|nr:heme uptake protein IsdC [Paenibacillus eucommiae]MBP1993175.1 heme uptake protein IsdC [Paenibacillus eucommiae]
MKFRITAAGIIAALWIGILLFPAVALGAAELEDGTYTSTYLVLKAENDSVSMANDYWEKPATIKVKDGKATVRLTINHSKWVTEFKVPGNGGHVDAKVIVTNKKEDKRVVEFAANVLEPILSKIHVTVADIDYDHDYTIRIVFDQDSFKLVKAADKETAPAATAKPAKPTAVAASGSSATEAGSSSGAEAAVSPKPAAAGTAKPEATANPGANAAANATAKPPKTPAAGEAAAAQSDNARGSGGQASSSSGSASGEDAAAATEAGAVGEVRDGEASEGVSAADGVTAANGAGIEATKDGEAAAAAAGTGAGAGDDGTGTGGEAGNGGSTGGEEPQEGDAAAGEPVSGEAIETFAAAGDAGPDMVSAGFNWRTPIIAFLLLLVGGAYIWWRRKVRES